MIVMRLTALQTEGGDMMQTLAISHDDKKYRARAERSYESRYNRSEPSWARSSESDYEDNRSDEQGLGAKAKDAMTTASQSLSSAGSTVAEGARDAKSAVVGRARSAASAASNAKQSLSDSATAKASAASDRATALQRRLAQGTEQFSEEARKRVIDARKRALDARDATATYAAHGRERAVNMFEGQPLVVGALAVAVGAALGAAVPRTNVEDRYFGDRSDQLIDDAERLFENEKQKLGNLAAAVKDEVQDIATEAKNRADTAAPAETAAKAVVDKAKSAGKRVAAAAKSEAKKQDVGKIKKS